MGGGGEAAGPDDPISKLDLFLGDDWMTTALDFTWSCFGP